MQLCRTNRESSCPSIIRPGRYCNWLDAVVCLLSCQCGCCRPQTLLWNNNANFRSKAPWAARGRQMWWQASWSWGAIVEVRNLATWYQGWICFFGVPTSQEDTKRDEVLLVQAAPAWCYCCCYQWCCCWCCCSTKKVSNVASETLESLETEKTENLYKKLAAAAASCSCLVLLLLLLPMLLLVLLLPLLLLLLLPLLLLQAPAAAAATTTAAAWTCWCCMVDWCSLLPLLLPLPQLGCCYLEKEGTKSHQKTA